MHRLGIVVFMVVVVGAAAVGTQGSPLAQYRVNQGPAATVRVANALGTSYTEWTVSIGQPSHEVRAMATSHACAICGKAMDPRDRQNYHIKSKVSKVSKHAHAECVTRVPSRAKAGGFLHENR